MTAPASLPLVWMRGEASSLAACHAEATTWGDVVAWATTEPERSAETMAEYHALDSQERHRLKRVAWIVGGRIVGGHRLAAAVAERTLLTIDIDDMTPQALADLEWQRGWPRGWAYCGHTTRSSTPDRPRVRLLLPLEQPLDAETYRLAALGLCSLLEAASVDEEGRQHLTADRATSCDPARLIYGPSLCCDAPHVAIHSEGDWPDIPVLVAAGRAEEARQAAVASTPAAHPRSGASGHAAQAWEGVGRDVVDDHGLEAMRAAGAVIVQSPRRASELTTHCPWHDDRSPSLDIAADGRMVCRAGCRPGGQPITWARVVARLRGCSEGEALRWARDLAGIPQRQVAPGGCDGVALLDDLGEVVEVEAPAPSRRRRWGLTRLRDIPPREVPPDARILGDILTMGCVTLLSGQAGIGKTTLVRQMLGHVAVGRSWLGMPGRGRPTVCAVCDYETPDLLREHAWRSALGEVAISGEEGEAIMLAMETPLLTDPGAVDDLLAEVAEHGVEVVVVDTLPAAMLTADENDAGEAQAAARMLRRIAAAGPAVLAISHPSKSGADIRGSSALPAAVETVLTYRATTPLGDDGIDETTELVLRISKNRVGEMGAIAVRPDGSGGLVAPDALDDEALSDADRIVAQIVASRRPGTISTDEVCRLAALDGVAARTTRRSLTRLMQRRAVTKILHGIYG